MKRFPKLNEPLIKEVLKHIKKFPAAYDQNDVTLTVEKNKETPCGAVGCFGAWAVLLSMDAAKRQAAADGRVKLSKARALLGLNRSEADFLFESASEAPKEHYNVIVMRLNQIRVGRKVAALLAKMPCLDDTSNVGMPDYLRNEIEDKIGMGIER